MNMLEYFVYQLQQQVGAWCASGTVVIPYHQLNALHLSASASLAIDSSLHKAQQ